MPSKNDLPSVSDASFMILVAEFPPQDLFKAVFGFTALPDDMWLWLRHIILCLVLVTGFWYCF